MNPILSVSKVHKSFGATKVLNGMSMQIEAGEVACIVGPSGSGKSTFIRCINGLVPFDSGEIRVGDIKVHQKDCNKQALRKRVGMVFQQYNLFPHRTVLDNVMMAPIHVFGERRHEVRVRALKLLERVRLRDKRDAYPHQLSGGQQQRVAIARSLAMRPDLMLFDEVTAALDPETVGEVLSTIKELADDGMACVMVTHEMAFAREVADHVYFTCEGRIIESGAPKMFFTQPRDPRTAKFLSHVLK